MLGLSKSEIKTTRQENRKQEKLFFFHVPFKKSKHVTVVTQKSTTFNKHKL